MPDATPTPTPTFAELALAAIEESLMGTLRAEWQSMSIGGKALTRMSVKEKLDARDRLKAEIARSKRKASAGVKTIGVIFT